MPQQHLFQLNLLLNLSLPTASPDITPIFANNGFEIVSIGPIVATKAATLALLKANGLQVQAAAAPELILGNHQKMKSLIFECKASSFGANTTQAFQARALLSDDAQYIAEFLGLPDPGSWEGALSYVVEAPHEINMMSTLEELSAEIRGLGAETANCASLGIRIDGEQIFVSAASESSLLHVTELDVSEREAEVFRNNAKPFYIIPIDSDVDAGDPHGRKVLEERVRNSLAATVVSQLINGEVAVSLDQILTDCIPVWNLMRGRDNAAWLRNAVRAYVRSILFELRGLGLAIEVNGDNFYIGAITIAQAEQTRSYFESLPFRRGVIDLWSQGVQADFSELAHGW